MKRVDQFGITITCSTTYFLEVGARASLKVATKGSPRGKRNSGNLDFSLVFQNKRGGVSQKILKCL